MRKIKISKSITTRESRSLDKYLQEIGKVALTEPEEEVQLAVKIRNGDVKALDRLVKANLRFVVSIAKQYQNEGLPLSDLINEGNLGLIKAAQRFDETRGFKFISYAVWWIRQSMLHAIAEHSRLVRVPLNKVGINSRVAQAFNVLEQEFEREPTAEELADMLDIQTEEVYHSLMASVRHLSVDKPLSDEDDNTLIDVLANPNASRADRKLTHEESLKTDIQRSLGILTDKQKQVICYLYGIGIDHPMTMDNIGQQLYITRERVRQIKDRALTKLREEPKCGQLRYYLG